MTFQYRYAVGDMHGNIIQSGLTRSTPELAKQAADDWDLLGDAFMVDGPRLVLMRRRAATEWERAEGERPTLAQLLEQHAQTTDGRYGEAPNCACGWRSIADDGWPAFEVHLLEELTAAGVAS